LTDPAIAVPEAPTEGIPVTYVPARNTLFLALALGWAEVLGAFDIFVGVNAVDYSGYPDCRPEYIAAFERLANLATRAGVEGGRFWVWTIRSPCPATPPTRRAAPAAAAIPAVCGRPVLPLPAWPIPPATAGLDPHIPAVSAGN